MATDEAWETFLRQRPSRGGRPRQYTGYQEAVRALLDDDDYYGGPIIEARTVGQPWWAEYGLGSIMILVMMATLLWALVDRDRSSARPAERHDACASQFDGRCR